MRCLSYVIILFIFVLFCGNSYSQSIYEPNKVNFTPAKERLESFGQRQGSEQNSLVKNIPFRSVGPSVMSGRVVDIDVSPADPTIFYVAYASGGIWKTTNNGTTFTPVFDDQACMTIGDIAVDWKRNIVYAGTGENNSSRSSYSGTGIYKTTNDGKEWIHLGLEETHRIGRIIISPENPDIIFTAAMGHLYSSNTERGVYKSIDGGMTWKKVLYVNDITGAIDIAFNAQNPGILLAAMWEKERRAWDFRESGPNSGIFRSDDGGETWTKLVNCGLPEGNGFGRTGLGVSPANPDIVYALIDNNNTKTKKKKKEEKITKDILRTITKENFLKYSKSDVEVFLKANNFPKEYNAEYVTDKIKDGSLKPVSLVEYLEDANSKLFDTDIFGAEVYRSSDFGLSWTKANEKPLDGLFYTYGYYFANIRVSPLNADKIYILGVPIVKSENGGKSFESINGENVHADHHALWIDPNREGHLINGNDGGLNLSYDDGKNWISLNSPSVGQFYSVNYDLAKPYNIYGGLQDNGVWYGSSQNKETSEWHSTGQYSFKNLMGGDGMQVVIDTRDNDIVYTGYQFGNYFRISKSTQNYKYITPKHKLGERPYRFNWQAPIQLSPFNQDIIYFGSNRLHYSTDKGESFTSISGDLTNGGKVGNVAYGTLTTISVSKIKEGLIYTGSDDGAVYVTKDNGEKWEKIVSGLPQNLWVSRVTASSHDAGTVYISLNGYRWDNFEAYVYKSTNYGKTWTRIGADLPKEPVNVIKEDPSKKNTLFVGMDAGLYASIDGGYTFMSMKGGLPNVPVHDIAIQPEKKELIAGTHGRSIYIADISYIEMLNADIMSQHLYMFDFESAQFSPDWGTRSFDWRYVTPPGIIIPFFVSEQCSVKAEILMNDTVPVYETNIICGRGINFFKYGMGVNDSLSENYVSYIKNRYKQEKVRAEDGNLYIDAGKYTVKLSNDRVFKKKSFEIKAENVSESTDGKGIPRPGD
ncbi:MAG: glycosyl hydrolase [Ignavibacteria bacterium]|nr:glycosyl hydrolase [Ignavibacteria bacterium]